ncbi:DUF4157 domain-containing protein [Microcoleus sp. ARI1-B5]|uniref:eCIS core domain-containing protein n=1 Tax=unclassified Microcoleus TaxID=2642155 RepID=UPI002FD23346
MSERVPAKNKISATPSQAARSSSPLLQQRPFTEEQSESFGSNSNISQELEGIQPKTIRRRLNWQNISVEGPARSNGMSLPGGIQRQQEEQEETPAIEHQVSAKKVETSTGELSNLTRATEGRSVQPKIDRPRLDWRNISVEAPDRSGGEASPQPIQRQQEEQEETPAIQAQFAADSEETSAGEFSNSTITSDGEETPAIQGEFAADSAEKTAGEFSNSTITSDGEALQPKIDRAGFNWRNIAIEAPPSSATSSTHPAGIQRQETSDEKQGEESTESIQMESEGAIQAKCSECEKQEKEEPNNSSIQTKLTVGAPGDKYEQEADSMAAKVMTMPDSALQQPIQRQTDEETEAVQMQPLVNSITPLVQRSSGEKEEIQMKSGAQRSSDGSSQASSSIESRLASSQGGGSALSDDVRSFMEPRFGADFSSVRVHTDSAAVQMNKELGAQAFARGSDIYFGAGKSPGKNELTAHELTHTVQQGGAVRLNKKLWRKPQLEKEEKEPVRAKEIPDRPNQLNLNKELRLKLDRPPGTKNIEAKQFPTQTSEITENKQQTSDFLPEKTEQKPLETKEFTSKDSARKPTPDTPKSSQTAVETAPQKTQLTGGETAGTETAPKITGVKEAAEAAPKPTVAENSPKPGAGAVAQQPPQQATPTPQNQPPNGKAPEAGAETAPGSNTKKQSDGPSAPGLTPQVAGTEAAASAMESGAGAGDTGGEMEGGQSETDPDIEAAAASNEKVELDPSESDAAMANLAQGGGAEAPTGGGGGGGGAAITEKPAPPVPDVSGAEPSAALASVSNLPPAQLLAGLGSVGTAVGNTVAKERAELAANPPQMESPSASPATGEKSAADKDLPPGKTPKAVEKTPEGQAKSIPQPKPVPLPPPAAAAVRQPQVKGDEQGKLSEGDIKNLQASLNAIPTRDPGLQNVSAGTPPQLELQGNADPQRALEQKAKLEKGLTEAQSQGQQDLAQPAGEQEIYPKVPKETLRAEGIGGGGAGGAVALGGGAAAGGVAGDEAISIIAQQQQGQQIQVAVAQAQGQMAAKRQEHTAQVAEEKAKSNKDIAKLQHDNAVEQEAQRAKAQTDIGQQRSQWQKEQDTLIAKSRQDADAAISKVGKEVSKEQIKGEEKAAEHIKEGETKAVEERRKGEEKAAAEKKKGEEQSGGIFGWLADKAKAFFEGIKQAIHAALDAARAAMKFAIEGAQKLATAAIEAARQVIVGIIKLAGEALIAIGDVMLAAFPEMRERYRNAMKAIVRTAENAVNAIANNLKKGVQVALNLLGKGLDFALGLMEKGLMAAVDIASQGVQGAISTAKAAVDALGAFSVLAKDIASSPGQWLSNLGAGAQDGVRNHLWGAFQTEVKEWFNQKVEGVLGLGMTVWKVLNQGGIKTDEVGKMAWEGIKSAIPPALIQILIEKVISAIVPAAGAVLAIIEGLQAAWGTVSRVIQAFDRFMAFLKAVKTGQSGPQFGSALAAAGVVLIDFVSNWLLKRVRGAASKVAGKIKEIAKKIGRKLKAATKKLGRKFGKVKDKFFGKKKADKRKGKESDSKHRDKKDKDDLAEKQRRVDKAVEVAAASVNKFSGKVVGKTLLTPILSAIKLRYRLKALNAIEQGENWAVHGEINPKSNRTTQAKVSGVDLTQLAGWRPSWRQTTNKALKKEYPQHFSRKNNKLKKGFDRRHIVSFEVIFKDLKHKIEGKPYNKAYDILSGYGYKPGSKNNPAILASAKAYLREKFNDPENVWVGESKENQERGREIGKLLRELEKAQNDLKNSQGKSKAERDPITQRITQIVNLLHDKRLDLPEKGTVKAAYKRILDAQTKRDRMNK